MLIDTHAHLNFKQFDRDREGAIKRSLKGGVWMLNVGSQYETSKKAVEIAEKYKQGVYAVVGIHPIYTEGPQRSLSIKELAKTKKVVAIGEIGLDYKDEYLSFKERQKQVFLEQLEMAKELELPVIFHCRMAHDDLFEVINSKFQAPNSKQILNSNNQNSKLRGVVHCFTGSWEEAKRYLELGLYLGFNGIIFKLDLDEIIRKTPLDKILLETDCPFLTSPKFKEKRNNPLGVKQVAEYIANIKKNSFEKVADVTTQNAKELFNI